MKLAAYNVESLFARPRAMNLSTWSQGKPVLEDFKNLNELIQEPVYTDKIKAKLLKIMEEQETPPNLVYLGV